MAADATLVQMAYKEAMANVPKFDPNIAKSDAGLVSKVMDPITKALETKNLETKEKNKENNELLDAQMAQFTETADAINRRLSTYERGGKEAGMHEQIYNNTYDYLGGLKEEFEIYNTVGDEDTPENKKKRIEILGRLDSVKNSVVQLRADVLEVGKLAGSEDGGNQMSKYAMGSANTAVLNEIINMDGDYSNVVQRWDPEKNDIYFDVTIPDEIFDKLPASEQELGKVRTWSAGDIKKNFKKIPQGKLDQLLQGSTDAGKLGGKWEKGDRPFDFHSDISNNIKIIGDDKSAAAHIFQSAQHGAPLDGYNAPGGKSNKWENGSWANALEANADLNGTYKVDLNDPKSKSFNYKLSSSSQQEVVDDLVNSGKIKMSDIDTDKSGDISTAEYEAVMGDIDNRDKVIDALVNPNNPLYDHELSVREYATFRAKQNEGLFNNNKPRDPSININTNPSSELQSPIDITPNPRKKDGTISHLPPFVRHAIEGDYYKNNKTGQVYKFENGKYTEITDQLETTVKSRIR